MHSYPDASKPGVVLRRGHRPRSGHLVRARKRPWLPKLSQGIAMSMVFRAADEPAASRPDYWRYVINERFRPMEVRFADGPGSHDELLTGVAGALRVTESTSSAGEVHRP